MFSLATKAMFGLAAVSLVSGVVYAVAVNDDAGMMLLFSASVVAVIAGLALAGPGAADRDAAPSATPEPPSTVPAGPSPWPLLTALALTIVAVGLATGPVLIVSGSVALAVVLAGWLGHSWTEHPTWVRENGERVSERLVSPVALPLGVFALVAVIVISFSRVLLAAPSANAATAVALVTAVLVLGGCTLIAAKPNLGSSAVIALAAVAGVATVAAGITGAVAGERDFAHHGSEEVPHAETGDDDDHAETDDDATPMPASGPTPTVVISAKGLAFDTKELKLPAKRPVELAFENAEPLPHNVSILGTGGKVLFKGEIITGPKTVKYKVPALASGEYSFRCDLHPAMAGVVVVA